MSNFTMKHYNPIHDLFKKHIKGFKDDCNLINGIPIDDRDMYYLVGVKRMHELLGELFAKDNSKFNSNLWDLDK